MSGVATVMDPASAVGSGVATAAASVATGHRCVDRALKAAAAAAVSGIDRRVARHSGRVRPVMPEHRVALARPVVTPLLVRRSKQ